MRVSSAWQVLVVRLLLTGPVVALAPVAWAQEPPNPEQLRRSLDDALNQLRAAQDRKNELAVENERLTARLGELQRELDQARGQLQTLQRDAAAYAERTFFLRSHYAAWQAFIERYPALRARWRVFLEADLWAAPSTLPEVPAATPATLPAAPPPTPAATPAAPPTTPTAPPTAPAATPTAAPTTTTPPAVPHAVPPAPSTLPTTAPGSATPESTTVPVG